MRTLEDESFKGLHCAFGREQGDTVIFKTSSGNGNFSCRGMIWDEETISHTRTLLFKYRSGSHLMAFNLIECCECRMVLTEKVIKAPDLEGFLSKYRYS